MSGIDPSPPKTGSPWRPSWPLIASAYVLLRLTLDRVALLNDPDTYLHIAVGRWIWAHGALPLRDPFSDSMAGAPWIPHEWLAELILAGTDAVGGWAGLTILATASVVIAVALLTRRLLDHFEPLSGMIVLFTATAMLLPHILARPHVLALPLLVLWSAELIRARDADRPPPWRVLPVMILWANLHGGFMAGIALALYLGCEAVADAAAGRRRAALGAWGVFFLAACATAMLTPNGIAGFIQPFRISNMPVLQSTFIEWRPLDLLSFQVIYLWIAAVAILTWRRLGPRPTRLLLFAVLCYAAIRHQRHLDLVAIIGPLALAGTMGPRIARLIRSDPPSPIAGLAARLAAPAGSYATLSAAFIFLIIGTISLSISIDRTGDPITPTSALAAARANGLTGPVFNTEGFGGFLVWSGVRTFIDGRIEMYGDPFLKQYLDAESGQEPALDDVLDRYHIGWVLLAPKSGAVAVLGRRPDWRRVYGDDVAVVFSRASGAS